MTTRRQLQQRTQGKHRPYFVEAWVQTVVKFDREGRTITIDRISLRAADRLRAKHGAEAVPWVGSS